MPAVRRYDQRRTVGLYVNRFQNHQLCIYCGDPATSVDHFLPLSVAAKMDWLHPMSDPYRKLLFTLPCCGDCNFVSGSRIFWRITAKRRYIQDRLRERFKHLLGAPFWDDEELNELGPNLRQYVIAKDIHAERIRRRIRWPRDRSRAARRDKPL